MSEAICIGDLVSGRACSTIEATVDGTSFINIIARPAGSAYWTLRLPRSSIMTVVAAPTHDARWEECVVTVLHAGQMVEVFLSDIEPMDGADR